MTRLLILGLVILGLASCGRISSGLGRLGVGQGAVDRSSTEVEGQTFKARTSSSKDDPRDYSVTVSPFATNPEAALDAASYQATRYCLLTFGGSDKVWTVGPDTPVDQLAIEDDTATLQGRCTQR